MADNLPLLPKKEGICAEVRPLLRTVFRELDYLPPLSIEEHAAQPPAEDHHASGDDDQLPDLEPWTDKFKADCEQIWSHEGEIKEQRAKRLARVPLPNIYRLHSPRPRPLPEWKLDRGLIDRGDLKPTIDQNAGRDGTLWVQSILNASSGDVTTSDSVNIQMASQPQTALDENTLQTISIGYQQPLVQKRRQYVSSVPAAPALRPDYIVCIPPQLSFVNFVIGQVYTQSVRLINISKYEFRLSLTPPKHQELKVEIVAARGLTLTSGTVAAFKVRFKPEHVRALHDRLVLRASCGHEFVVDIACYMKPPVLDILVPNVPSSLLVCTADEVSTPIPRHLVGGPDVVEMGAQLLGDIHHMHLLLHCESEYATFFLLTEDAWITWNLDCLSAAGSLVAGGFVWWPAWWRGGGVVSACVWCRGERAGAHVAALKLLSSTAVNRQLYLMADVVLYKPNHLTIEAQPKDYDICSEDDPDCEYYVNAGTAFPHRSLSTTIKLYNNSPVVYNYYWVTRAWGVCCCWETENSSQTQLRPEDDISHICVGASETINLAKNDPEAYEEKLVNSRLVSIEPGRSLISPRSSCTLQVRLPDVGRRLGVQRAVLMLIVKDVPKESFPENFEPSIISTKEVETVSVPGFESPTREVCEVLVAQVEVWWEVVPLRFVLEPAVLPLPYSRRLKSISIDISAWQLFGWTESYVEWDLPEHIPRPPVLRLTPDHSALTTINLPLPVLPNEYPATDVLTMVAANEEWRSNCVVKLWCSTRHPPLQPPRTWLGVVRPGAHLHASFLLTNDTCQDICWWGEAFRWLGENPPGPACQDQIPCNDCQQHSCTCDFLKPRRGVLADGESVEICYDLYSPMRDGCVVTLVRARRCEPDLARVPPAPPAQSRAALVAYRVLAPALLLRALPCLGRNPDCGEGCGLDLGAVSYKLGTSILRPSAALVVGRRTCYRLCFTNITPLPTAVSFDDPIDNTDILNVKFTPKYFALRKYGKKEIRVVLEARRVCSRRLFVYRAQVEHAHSPVYLLIDTAISGVQISCQVPIGGAPQTDEFIILRRTQRMSKKSCEHCVCSCQCRCGPSPQELFEEEDRKRARAQENICRCPFEMVYIPPQKERDIHEPPVPEEGAIPRIEFVTSPPPLTRVCPCDTATKPVMREGPQCASLQFIQIPLRKVCERLLVLSNESVVTARYRCHVRRWPRLRTSDASRALRADEWAGDVRAPGVAVECVPACGVLAARDRHELRVQVYADCWGLYWDQIVIQVDNVEPIVLDVWVEAVGTPLVFKMQARRATDEYPTLWLSAADPARAVLAHNESRADLLVHAYVTHENDREQDALPFRLYLRFHDVLPPTCPCYTPSYPDTEETSVSSVTSVEIEQDMETGLEIYIGPDLGLPCDEFYQVEPAECRVRAGETCEWRVSLRAPPYSETAPRAALLLRLRPAATPGGCWYRGEPLARVVRLRQAPREDLLKLSCDEIVVKQCALNLPYGDFLRVRKHFYIQNLGNGAAAVNMYTSMPWCVVHRCDAHCSCARASQRRTSLVLLTLPPLSCTDVCVEVCISTVEAWPVGGEHAPHAPYAPQRRETTPLHLYDNYQLLLTLPLTLDIEYPVIQTTPAAIDFGYVTDDDSRKAYVTVSHTSRTEVLNLKLKWVGCSEFEIWPPSLEIAPGGKARFYIQYTAVWRQGYAEGCVVVSVWSGEAEDEPVRAGRWCRAEVPVRAAPTRDHKCRADLHDHTDDTRLLPRTHHRLLH